MDKKDISRFQIDHSKIWADGKKYFSLFEKHIPTNLNEMHNILIYDISNLDVINQIININPKAKYWINGNHDINDALKALGFAFNEVSKEDNLEKYNIPNMKFDCIIMNPPYDRNLHLKILSEAITHLKDDDSVCVNLSPTTWLAKRNINRPFAKYRNKFNGYLNSIELISHDIANNVFGTGNSIEELGIYEMNCSKKSKFNLETYGFNSNLEYSLFCKIDMMDKNNIITFNSCKHNHIYGDIYGTRKPFDLPIYSWHGADTCREAVVIDNPNKKVSMVLYFNSENERINFLNSLDTTFMNWYYKMFVVPGDCKIINHMFRMSDYTQPWTDERFYKFFNLTEDEIKLIETTMEKYK